MAVPETVKGIYVTAWSAATPKRLASLIGLLDRTELNAMVIDVRDNGSNYVDPGLPLATSAKANEVAMRHPEKILAKLKEHNIWPIARIACFRDAMLPLSRPDLAVQQANGKPWHDRSNHTWLDPYNKENWEYVGQIVDYALTVGFPEIQLDYVRFPSEGKSATQKFPAKGKYSDHKAEPEDVIAAFAETIKARVRARNGRLSADIFGIISSSKSDQGIGQRLEKIASPFDVISPMVYPSHFAKGEYGIANPNLAPHAIVKKSLDDFKKRLPKASVRPWLQDFSLGAPYGKAQVMAQILAAKEAGYSDFLLWNASNRYTETALKKEKSPFSEQKPPSTIKSNQK